MRAAGYLLVPGKEPGARRSSEPASPSSTQPVINLLSRGGTPLNELPCPGPEFSQVTSFAGT